MEAISNVNEFGMLELSNDELMLVEGGSFFDWIVGGVAFEAAKTVGRYYYDNPPVIDNSDGIYEY